MASRGRHRTRKATSPQISSRTSAGIVLLTPYRLAKLKRNGLNRLNSILQSADILSEAGVLGDEENFELRYLAAEIERALNFAFTQSH